VILTEKEGALGEGKHSNYELENKRKSNKLD